MKKMQSFCLGALLLCMVSCQSTSPEKFFDQTILNTNLVGQFEPSFFGKMLEQYTVERPGVQSSKKKGDEAQKVVNSRIVSIEHALEKVKVIDANDEERKLIKQNSIELFEAVLAVYKNEYIRYAKLCDEKSTSPEKQALLKKVEETDFPKIQMLMSSLYEKGKVFADKHKINVKW